MYPPCDLASRFVAALVFGSDALLAIWTGESLSHDAQLRWRDISVALVLYLTRQKQHLGRFWCRGEEDHHKTPQHAAHEASVRRSWRPSRWFSLQHLSLRPGGRRGGSVRCHRTQRRQRRPGREVHRRRTSRGCYAREERERDKSLHGRPTPYLCLRWFWRQEGYSYFDLVRTVPWW